MWFLCSGMFTVSSTVKGNIVTQCYKAFNQMKTNGEHDAAESLWGAGGWKTFGHAGKNDTFYRRDSFILCICSTVQRMNFFSFNQRLNIFLKSNHVYRVDLFIILLEMHWKMFFFLCSKRTSWLRETFCWRVWNIRFWFGSTIPFRRQRSFTLFLTTSTVER